MRIVVSIMSLVLVGCSSTNTEFASEPKALKANESSAVLIAPNCISMPIGRIGLIRLGDKYCAIKFLSSDYKDYGNHKTAASATYESYYQDDGSGVFVDDIGSKERKLSHKYIPIIGRFALGLGDNEIKCGPMKFLWSGEGTIYMHSKHDDKQLIHSLGVELAPTPWTDISQVNVFDPRIRWYKYDENREDIVIPVNKLWRGK